MGIAVVKTIKPKASRWSVGNGLAVVAAVGVSIGIGVSMGWYSKPSCPIYDTPPPSAAPSCPGTALVRPSFLHFGDSLTELGGDTGGWVARLNQHFGASIDVLNRGRSGYNTKQTREEVVPKVLQSFSPTTRPVLITLWLGANDAALENGPNKAQHIPVDQYKVNLEAMIHELREFAPLAKILLISPPVVDDATRRAILVNGGNPSDPLDRTNAQAGAYAAACVEVAKAVENTADRVTVLDMYTYLMQTYPMASERAKLLSDGLHFSDKGNEVVFEHVKQQIQALLPVSLIGN